jgi:hypothetical protein
MGKLYKDKNPPLVKWYKEKFVDCFTEKEPIAEEILET